MNKSHFENIKKRKEHNEDDKLNIRKLFRKSSSFDTVKKNTSTSQSDQSYLDSYARLMKTTIIQNEILSSIKTSYTDLSNKYDKLVEEMKKKDDCNELLKEQQLESEKASENSLSFYKLLTGIEVLDVDNTKKESVYKCKFVSPIIKDKEIIFTMKHNLEIEELEYGEPDKKNKVYCDSNNGPVFLRSFFNEYLE